MTPRSHGRHPLAPRTPARTRRAMVPATAAPSGAPRARAVPRPHPARAERAESRPGGPPERRSRALGRGRLLAGLSPSDAHAVLERVDERLPGGLDDVLRHADRAPHLIAVGSIEQHPGNRAGALGLVEDAHLEVDQVDVAQVWMDLYERLPERTVEG